MKTPEYHWPHHLQACFSETPEQTAVDLADTVADRLAQQLTGAERASLAVSGGSTPVPFFQALSLRSLEWSRVDVVLVDERWVDPSDGASNTRLVREHLLQNNAQTARFFSLKQAGDHPQDGLAGVLAELSSLKLPLDVLVLGMGNDGHTASLFPDAPELARAMDLHNGDRAVAMTPPSQAHARVTLTRAVMNGARFTALHLQGKDKLDTLERALAQPDDLLAMPVRAFFKPGLQVFWSP